MQKQHTKLIEALERVEDFLQKNSALMGSVITSKAHENFTASRERLVEHMSAQEEHTRGIRSTVATKRQLASRLVQAHMRPISIIARRHLPHVGEFAALKLPTRKLPFVILVASGYGMARAAKIHEPVFVEAGLAPDFVAQLVAATDALKDGITDKGQTEALRVKATVGLRKEGRFAGFTLRLLDAMVRSAVKKDDALLDQWAKVSRIAAAAVSPRALNDTTDPADPEPAEPGGSDDAPTAPAPVTPQSSEAPPAA